MATFKPIYGTSTPISCTLASLAASSTIGRSSLVVDNTSNLFVDALVTLAIKTGVGTIAGNKGVYVYAYGSEDGVNFEQEESLAPGVDSGYTINSPTLFRIAAVIPVLTGAKVYEKVFTIARLFGGILPRKWGLIVCNDTGIALDATEANHIKQYSGINWLSG